MVQRILFHGPNRRRMKQLNQLKRKKDILNLKSSWITEHCTSAIENFSPEIRIPSKDKTRRNICDNPLYISIPPNFIIQHNDRHLYFHQWKTKIQRILLHGANKQSKKQLKPNEEEEEKEKERVEEKGGEKGKKNCIANGQRRGHCPLGYVSPAGDSDGLQWN